MDDSKLQFNKAASRGATDAASQLPLLTAQPFQRHRDDNEYSPIEIAIRRWLGYK